jgi:hypothetical protein
MARIGRAPEPAVGEHWAYRARLGEPLVEVVVLRLGVKTPRRVLVRWIDDAFEGQHDWVPPARLKAFWSELESFQEHERQWDHAVALADACPEPVQSAVGYVFNLLVDEQLARPGWNAEAGVVLIRDVAGLGKLIGVSPELADETAFFDDGELVVSMPTAVSIARAAAARNPDVVLRHVDHEQADARREAIHGRYYRGRGRAAGYSIPAEICRADDEKHGAPVRAILREWAGAEAVDRRSDLAAAREEATRLAAIAAAALEALREAGLSARANRIEGELGPVAQRQ